MAASTKEFGLYLGPIWLFSAFRHWFPRRALLARILPGAAVLIVKASSFRRLCGIRRSIRRTLRSLTFKSLSSSRFEAAYRLVCGYEARFE